MNKAKIKKFVEKYIDQQNIQFVILLVPLSILFYKQVSSGSFAMENFLDTTILVSFILAILCEIIAKIIVSFVQAKCEDASKLTEDYVSLAKKYRMEPLITHTNIVNGKAVVETFPVICLCDTTDREQGFILKLDDSQADTQYQLPAQVADRSDEIMKAHGKSTIYNNMNVRVNDIRCNGNKVVLTYSHTTYFDSMITNRAMDYEWENGKTIREIFEPGPFVSELSNSKLSNHLGFNGFVETSDGKIIFVQRGKKLSIGKETLADSIGASMKVIYCYNKERKLTVEGIYNAIRHEIQDELKIPVDKLDEGIEHSIFAFYRDLVEGGKPQFLFYYKLKDMTAAQVINNFKQVFETNNQKRKEENKKLIVDGTKFYAYSIEELKQAQIYAGKMVTPDGITHRMMPSASASVVMLLKYLGVEE